MIIIKTICFIVGLIGLSLVWGAVGFVWMALNQESFLKLKTPFKQICKSILCGPFYFVYHFVRFKNKRDHEINMKRRIKTNNFKSKKEE